VKADLLPSAAETASDGRTFKSRTQKSRVSRTDTFTLPFNPLRYMAMQLKDKNRAKQNILLEDSLSMQKSLVSVDN